MPSLDAVQKIFDTGSHYLEIQVAKHENILDPSLAKTFCITKSAQVAIRFYCGIEDLEIKLRLIICRFS